MDTRTSEQIFVGLIVALFTAIINQVFAGKVNYLWVFGGFLGAVLLYGAYQRFGRFPFIKWRVTNIHDGKGLLFRDDLLEGKRVGDAWQFQASLDNWAIYGPYLRQPLRKGKYRAIFKIKVDDTSGENRPIVHIDVAVRSKELGDKRLVGRTLTPTDFNKADEYHYFLLNLHLMADERDLELRVWSNGGRHIVTLDYIRLSKRLF